jgi:two-component system response regulator LytT
MAETPKMRRLPIRDDYAVRLLRFEDIVHAEAREKRVYVNTRENEFRTYYTLKTLETILPVENFIRIHDSYIVNMDAIEELIFLGNHAYEIKLNTGKCLPVGRTRYSEFLKRFGVDNP